MVNPNLTTYPTYKKPCSKAGIESNQKIFNKGKYILYEKSHYAEADLSLF